jgi:hypothetical protein
VSNQPAGQRELLVALVRANVHFVVIGGYAVAAHGYERATRDVEIVFATDLENCERFASLLRRLDAHVRVADLPAPDGQITGEWLALSWIAGLDHSTLDSRALTVELADGTELRVCSYEDLVSMKRVADRPRDREDLHELEAIRDETTDG